MGWGGVLSASALAVFVNYQFRVKFLTGNGAFFLAPRKGGTGFNFPIDWTQDSFTQVGDRAWHYVPKFKKNNRRWLGVFWVVGFFCGFGCGGGSANPRGCGQRAIPYTGEGYLQPGALTKHSERREKRADHKKRDNRENLVSYQKKYSKR